MKTKLTLLLSVIALAGFTSTAKAGRDLDMQMLQKRISESRVPSSVSSGGASGEVKYVPASNGKGGIVLVRSNEPATTNIALFKSKGASSNSPACCAKH